MLQPRGDEHEGGVVVGEGVARPCPPPDLAVYSLDSVVGSDAAPVLGREAGVGQRLGNAVAHDLGGTQAHRVERAGDLRGLPLARPLESCARIALSMRAASFRLAMGTFPSTLRLKCAVQL